MIEVGPGFLKCRNRKLPRHGTVTQPFNLGEDEPHPMGCFASVSQFGAYLVVNSVLRLDEALEIVWITHRQESGTEESLRMFFLRHYGCALSGLRFAP